MSESGLAREIRQVPDDVELLDLMLDDQRTTPKIYGTTNYYLAYDKDFDPLSPHGRVD